jgi:hypothetical protein
MKKTYGFAFTVISCFVASYANAITGELVAENLNERYNHTKVCSLGEPDYACSGIIIHTFDDDADSNSIWYPTTQGIERGVVSFSWLRNDINIYKEDDGDNGSIWGDQYAAGIMFTTSNQAILNNKTPPNIFCSYGVNGETKSRENFGCSMNAPNETIPNPDNYSSCYPLGINTAQQLVDKYFINKEGVYGYGDLDQCSFSSSRAEFLEAMKVGPLAREYSYTRNNEIVLKEWSNVPINKIPLNAIFHTVNYKAMDNIGLGLAQGAQNKYFEQTGEFMPIITVDMQVIRNGKPAEVVSPFIYNPEVQVVPEPIQ